MRVWRHASQFCEAARGAVLVVGNFDGCHRAHQALISKAGREAARRGCKLLAINMAAADPILQERASLALLRQLGVDGVLLRPLRAGNEAL